MTKPRVPHTWADAMTQVAGRIGWDAACVVVDRKERLLRRWSEPNDPRFPSLAQALALDAAYLADGGEDAPFLAAFAHQLDREMVQATACHRLLVADAATPARETGEAIALSLAIAQPGASPRDQHRAVVEVRQAHTAIGALLRRVTSFLPHGAGPCAGKAGGTQ